MKKRVCLSFLFIPLILSSCKTNDIRPKYTSTVYAFGSTFNVCLYDGKAIDASNIASLIYEYGRLSDAFLEYDDCTNVYNINLNKNKTIEIDERLFEMVSYCVDMQDKFDGLFNILVGDLAKLWKESLISEELPNETMISKCVENIANTSIELNAPNKIMIKGSASLDLGGVAKGYVVGKIKQYLVDNNIKHYLIDGGRSSILLSSKDANKTPFIVGLNNTEDVFSVCDVAIGTSSISEQYNVIDNKIYSHIVNPITGSAQVKYDCVTIFGQDPALLDILSTVCMLQKDVESIVELFQEYNVEGAIYQNYKRIYNSPSIPLL